jgi:hypothetical protein
MRPLLNFVTFRSVMRPLLGLRVSLMPQVVVYFVIVRQLEFIVYFVIFRQVIILLGSVYFIIF